MELGEDEIKNYIQKGSLGWFGHMMWMREARIPISKHKNGGITTKGKTQNNIYKIRKDIQMRGKIGKKYWKIWSARINTLGDFPVKVDPYLWKGLKKDGD